MADRGHELTETILAEIEGRCKEEYEIAAREMRKKYRDYMKQFEAGRKEQYELWKAGKITKKDYTDWVYRHTMMGKRWEQMANVLAADMHNANDIAHAIAAGQMPDIFALNANYATFQIEHDGRIDTGFTLYSHDTAAYLMQDQQLMPGPSTKKAAQIAANKDMQWNYRKIQSAVMQGVLQGESPYEVANRLTSVAQMNYNAAVRYARTMGTNAQNAGRYEGYHRAKDLGVDLKIEWSATLDSRTRHEHRLLDGQRREVGEPFEVDGFKIMWPGQSSGPGSSDIPQELIWNCRCTLLAWVKGFEGETVKSSPKMGNMTYDEWKHAKEPKPKNVASQATTTPAIQNTFKNTKGIDQTFIDGMDKALASCDNDTAKAVYAKYADDLKCNDDKYTGTAKFSRYNGGVYLNAADVAAGSSYETPFETAFHEFGHMIDWLSNGKTGTYLSETSINGKTLMDVMKDDFKAFKKVCNVTRREDVIPILRKENMDKYTKGNLSDILEKFTGQSYPLGIGHGAEYHKRPGATEREFFAEVLDSAVTNKPAYEQLVRVFPNGVDFVWELIKGVI